MNRYITMLLMLETFEIHVHFDIRGNDCFYCEQRVGNMGVLSSTSIVVGFVTSEGMTVSTVNNKWVIWLVLSSTSILFHELVGFTFPCMDECFLLI